jgi:hypothetical protein
MLRLHATVWRLMVGWRSSIAGLGATTSYAGQVSSVKNDGKFVS